MISEMSFVEIVGPKGVFEAAVDTIQDVGVLHVEEVPLAEHGGRGLLHRIHLSEPQDQEKAACEELMRVLDEAATHIPSSALAQLQKSPEFLHRYEQCEKEPLSSISVTARALHTKVRSFVRRRRNLRDDLRVLSAYEEVAGALAPLVESHELPQNFEFVGVIFQQKNREARDLLVQELRRLTAGEYRFLQAGLSGGRIAALVGFHKQFADEVRTFIADAGISEMTGPRYLRDKPFEEALAALQEDLASLRRERDALEQQVEGFYAEEGPLLLALQHVCRDRFARLDVVSQFAQTSYTFVIKGWVPRRRLSQLGARLKETCGEAIVLRELRAHGTGQPPVALDNPKPVHHFEPLLRLLPLPQYGTIDPTLFVATFFPPMFGLMLGDVGYGALLIITALILYRFSRGRKLQKKLATVLGCCAFYTILFGLVFGEFFGSLGHHIGLKPLWRERFSLTGANKADALLGYLAIAVAVGVLQVMFGLVLGIVNARRTGERGRVLSYAARIAGVFALFFFVGRLANFLPLVFTSCGVVCLLLFLVLMIYQSVHRPAHGLLLPLEVLSTAGNILSYARIMAIGMVSVVLALLANKFGGMVGNIALACIIVVLVHALNLVLGVIDPTIQGLRLHYVEFFSKFYLTGGMPYSPFKKIGGELA